MTCSLIVTTYNWKEALELVLLSAISQSCLPDEIIVADDGSQDDTKELIRNFSKKSKIPIIHSWQEDDGFRAAQSRNLAISKSSCEYIILVDGDMILHSAFISEHKKFAKHGFFIQGSRVLLSEEQSRYILKNKKIKVSIFDKGIKNRLNALHSNILSLVFLTKNQSHKGIKTCNMSFYKEECCKINGFNNDFVGWGREDSEFIARMYNSGIQRLNLKFNAIAYHIWHNENTRDSLQENDLLLKKTIANISTFCENGISNLNKKEMK